MGAVPGASPCSRAEGACMRMSPRFAFRSLAVSRRGWRSWGRQRCRCRVGASLPSLAGELQLIDPGSGGMLREYRSSRKTSVNRPFPSSVPSSRTVPFIPLLL